MGLNCASLNECATQAFNLCKDFVNGLDLKVTLLTALVVYIIFLRKWGLKKIGSLFLALFFFFLITVCVNSFLGTLFHGVYDAQLTTFSRVVFIFICVLVFVYYAALKD